MIANNVNKIKPEQFALNRLKISEAQLKALIVLIYIFIVAEKTTSHSYWMNCQLPAQNKFEIHKKVLHIRAIFYFLI